jgi:hypothetical protein
MRRVGFDAILRTCWLLVVFTTATACGTARSDVIVLRGGGEIQGKVITDPKQPETVQVLMIRGKHPLVLKKQQIVKVVPKAGPLDEYLARRQKLGPTAQAQYELGEWCTQNRLPDLATIHYEATIAVDENHELAHKKLGHVNYAGRWLSPDELREVQGLVKYKGQWITQEERERRERSARTAASQASWVRRIKLLRQAIVQGSEDRRREAEVQLMQIEDKAAVVPLMKVLGEDEAPMRLLLAHVLGAIKGKEAAQGLAEMLLAETQDNVRLAFLDRLKDRDDPGVIPYLVKALRSENLKVVNRAAWALGNLGAVNTVPTLVGSLLGTEDHVVMDPPAGSAPAYSPVGPALMAMNPGAVAFLTPPAMAPGAVAYGAVAVPYVGAPPIIGAGGLMSTGTTSGRGPIPRIITLTYQNVEVRNALVKLTGQDFGYDIAAWKRWVKTSFNPNPAPVRQVPQP